MIATANPGKFHEISEGLKDLDYEILGIADLGLKNEFVENGDSHEEIALKKAMYFHEQCGFITLADDSGIVVDALKTELGVKTRRWGAGEKASDEEWIKYFLNVMDKVSDEKRTARFVCCACILLENGDAHLFLRETTGKILRELRVPIKPGLPLSSLFIPDGYDKVYSELSTEDKHKISHRGKACTAVKDFLTKMMRGSC